MADEHDNPAQSSAARIRARRDNAFMISSLFCLFDRLFTKPHAANIDGQRLLVERLLDHRARRSGIGLGIEMDELDRPAESTALGIDLVGGEPSFQLTP